MPLTLLPSEFSFALPQATSYGAAKVASAQLDTFLGLRTEETEKRIAEQASQWSEHQAWIGLSVGGANTPYSEFFSILEHLRPSAGETVVDLGAGYGRMGIVIGHHYPGVRFLGIEVVRERVQEASRVYQELGFHPRCQMVERDLASGAVLEEADIYFIYDFGHRAAIEKVLGDLQALAAKRPICVIARGRGCRHEVDTRQQWLSQVVKPEHFENYSIYRSA